MPELSVKNVLSFLIDVFDEAEHTDGMALNIVPVLVVDDLSTMLPTIREVCRFAGHRVRVATELVDNGVPATVAVLNAELREHVEAIGVDPAATGTIEHLTVVVDDGQLTVRVGRAGPPTNPGDRNQLGLLTALLDPTLGDGSLEVLVYDETDVAEDSKERIWAFVMDTLPRSGLRATTLLVLIGSSSIEYARHCRAGTGIRWAFIGGEMWRRSRSQSDATSIARLAAGDGPIVLMLGAGVSASSGLPLGNELRDSALARYVPDLAETGVPISDLAREFYHQVAEKHRLLTSEEALSVEDFIAGLTLERVLREEARMFPDVTLPTLVHFDILQQAALAHPGRAITELQRMLRLRARLVLLTVNFDQLIEDGAMVLRPGELDPYEVDPTLAATGKPALRLFVTEDDLCGFPAYLQAYLDTGGAVPLVKLHGSIDKPETVQANVDRTLQGLSQPATEVLQALLAPVGEQRPLAYVGCSMRDPDITRVVGNRSYAERLFETWVAPLVDPNVIRWAWANREAAWRAVNGAGLYERTVTQTADTFMEQLRRRLEP